MFLLLVGLTIAGFALLHSQRFHAYLLQTAQQKASAAIGTPVHLRDFSLSWIGSGPAVEVYGVLVEGATPHARPPIVEAESIRVQVTISSLWHRSWYINDLRVQHPVVRVLQDAQGHTNLPNNQSSQPSSGGSSIFDIGVRHLQIQQGEIYFNDLKNSLDADLRELALESRFDVAQTRYSGTISYRNGHVQWQSTHSVTHDLDARFALTPAEFNLESAELTASRSHVSLSASLRNYSQPAIHAVYKAVLDSGEFRKVLNQPSLPAGLIQLSGVLDNQTERNHAFLATAKASGEVRSARLTIPYEQKTASVVNLHAVYTLTHGDVSVSNIRAGVLGGEMTGNFAMRNLVGTTNSSLAARLDNISIAEIGNLLGSGPAGHAAVRGSLGAVADAKWGKTTDDLIVHGNVTIKAGLHPSHGGPETPFNGVIQATYTASDGVLSLARSSIRSPQTSVLLDGTISRKSALRVQVESRDLHELEEIARGFRAPDSTPIDLYGQGTVNARVRGSTRNPYIEGLMTATDLKVRGTSWRLLRGRASANPGAVRVENGELVSATKGRITFNLKADLQQWSMTPSSTFSLRAAASGLNAEELAKAAGVTTQVSGNLSAEVQGSGTQLTPSGHGRIELSNGKIAGEPLKTATVTFDGNGAVVNAKLDAAIPAGSLTANLRYEPRSQAYLASVRALDVKLEQLETVKEKNLHLTGVVNLTADGRGTLQNPALKASLEIPRLQIRDQVVNSLRLDTEISDHVAHLNLSSQMLGTRAGGHGTVQLTGDYPADIVVDTEKIPLQPLFAMYVPSQAPDLVGQTELHATLRGPLKNKNAVEAHLTVPSLNLNYKNTIQLAATAPIHADYANGALDVKRSVIRGTGTELTFQAHVPMEKTAPVSLLLQGTVDLQLAEMLSSDITSAGQIRFDIDSFGARSDPNIQGQVRIVNASLTQTGVPLGLRDGNGVLTLTRNRFDVTQFEGKVGGGTVTVRGGVIYRPNLQFDMAMNATDVRVLYQQSIRSTINSNLFLSGQYDQARLRGEVNIEQLSFTSNFDLANFAGQFGGGAATPPPTGGFADQLALQIAIQTPGGLNLSNSKLSLAGSANLQVRGTAAQPVLLGRINLSDGDLIFAGNRYLVQSGTIDFRNPSRTEPVVDISASTSIQQYEIQMHFWGPADHLHTNYSSDPALPPSDVINLIAFGKTSEASVANPTPPGTLGAESLVASQVSSQLTSRIEKLAGISQLSIDPSLGSGQEGAGARIAVQQRVTSKIFVTFSTDVTSTGQQAVKLEYQLNRSKSLTVVRDQNGGFSFETSFRKVW